MSEGMKKAVSPPSECFLNVTKIEGNLQTALLKYKAGED